MMSLVISVITGEAMLSNSLIEIRVTVAPVSTNMVDGILGLDFQRSQNCTINVAKGSILIHGHKVYIQFEGQIGCY
jgi:hypothetical protein